jgi:hypothetical protein
MVGLIGCGCIGMAFGCLMLLTLLTRRSDNIANLRVD